VSLSLLAKSQENEKKFTFGAGAALSLPTGDLKESHEFAVGVDIQGNYAITPNIHAFLQTGLSVFRVKNDIDNSNGTLHVPILLGAKYYYKGFHAGAGAGYGIWTASGGNGSLKGFTYSPQVGYQIDKYDFLVHYTASSVTGATLSYFGIKAFRLF